MSPSTPAPVVPQAPPPPANPPMFGANNPKKKGGGGTPQQFDASVLGSVPTAQSGGQKSLLGQ